jgi:cytochrome b561
VRAATITHALLYLALLAMPISGWLFNSAANFPLRWFGLFAVPALSGPDPALKAAAGFAHLFLFWCIAALFTVHAVAALDHHYRIGDEVLRRMWWRRGAT